MLWLEKQILNANLKNYSPSKFSLFLMRRSNLSSANHLQPEGTGHLKNKYILKEKNVHKKYFIVKVGQHKFFLDILMELLTFFLEIMTVVWTLIRETFVLLLFGILNQC